MLSVIICTHNPRRDHLERTLSGLRAQTLPKEQWELLLIDNASAIPIGGGYDLSWHPNAVSLLEPKSGKVNALKLAIRTARGKLLAVVDDDNVLDEGTLATHLEIAGKYPFLGLWGGRVDPEFEVPAPEWSRRFWCYLAVRSVERSYWASITDSYGILPPGAGSCTRREVAEAWVRTIASVPAHLLDFPTPAEDTEWALTACDLGYGYGMFKELRLRHLIPKERLTEAYLLRQEEQIACCTFILQARRDRLKVERPVRTLRSYLGAMRRRLTMKRMDRLVLEARLRGWRRAREVLTRST